jgi:hypothetical protein
MRRISVIMLAIASVLAMFACVSNQTSTSATPKVGKPLVKRLPAKIEGVELVGGTVRTKSGYKFVTQPNGTVTVARMGGGGGGPGLGGTWSCSCSGEGTNPSGTCTVMNSGSGIWCYKSSHDTCNATCQLVATTTGLGTAIVLY